MQFSGEEKKNKSTILKKLNPTKFPVICLNLGRIGLVPNKLLVQNNYFFIGVKQEDLAATNLNATSANLVQFH